MGVTLKTVACLQLDSWRARESREFVHDWHYRKRCRVFKAKNEFWNTDALIPYIRQIYRYTRQYTLAVQALLHQFIPRLTPNQVQLLYEPGAATVWNLEPGAASAKTRVFSAPNALIPSIHVPRVPRIIGRVVSRVPMVIRVMCRVIGGIANRVPKIISMIIDGVRRLLFGMWARSLIGFKGLLGW